MDNTYQELAEYLYSLHLKEPQRQFFIGVSGSPGSGKTTLTSNVLQKVNALAEKDLCIVLPMDGFHYYKSQLAAMKNAEEALQRRGAEWTFDAPKFCSVLRSVKLNGFGSVPSFDHGVGDPVEDDIKIESTHRIILVEGNYLYLDLPMWKPISELLDERWFIEVDENVAMERVVKRHIGTGNTEEKARFRVENNDRLNARQINQSKSVASKYICSIEE